MTLSFEPVIEVPQVDGENPNRAIPYSMNAWANIETVEWRKISQLINLKN